MNEVEFSTTDILSDAHYPMQDLIRRIDHALDEDHKLGQKATACTCTAQDKKNNGSDESSGSNPKIIDKLRSSPKD